MTADASARPSSANSDEPEPLRTGQDLAWLDRSLVGLRQAAPEMSAHVVLSRRQKVGLVAAGVLLIGCFILRPIPTAQWAVAVGTALYAATLLYRLLLV